MVLSLVRRCLEQGRAASDAHYYSVPVNDACFDQQVPTLVNLVSRERQTPQTSSPSLCRRRGKPYPPPSPLPPSRSCGFEWRALGSCVPLFGSPSIPSQSCNDLQYGLSCQHLLFTPSVRTR